MEPQDIHICLWEGGDEMPYFEVSELLVGEGLDGRGVDGPRHVQQGEGDGVLRHHRLACHAHHTETRELRQTQHARFSIRVMTNRGWLHPCIHTENVFMSDAPAEVCAATKTYSPRSSRATACF